MPKNPTTVALKVVVVRPGAVMLVLLVEDAAPELALMGEDGSFWGKVFPKSWRRQADLLG